MLASRIENTNLLLVSISGCPVEKAMVPVNEEGEDENTEDIYDGLNVTDFLEQKKEVTRFR